MTGPEFRQLRLGLGLSQNELARALGILSGRTIQRIEKGEEVRGPLALAIRKLVDDANDAAALHLSEVSQGTQGL